MAHLQPSAKRPASSSLVEARDINEPCHVDIRRRVFGTKCCITRGGPNSETGLTGHAHPSSAESILFTAGCARPPASLRRARPDP